MCAHWDQKSTRCTYRDFRRWRPICATSRDGSCSTRYILIPRKRWLKDVESVFLRPVRTPPALRSVTAVAISSCRSSLRYCFSNLPFWIGKFYVGSFIFLEIFVCCLCRSTRPIRGTSCRGVEWGCYWRRKTVPWLILTLVQVRFT